MAERRHMGEGHGSHECTRAHLPGRLAFGYLGALHSVWPIASADGISCINMITSHLGRRLWGWRDPTYGVAALSLQSIRLCQTKRSRCLAMLESGYEQPVPIFQQLARSDPSGRNDVRAVPAVAVQR
jgi:hypothetical protein